MFFLYFCLFVGWTVLYRLCRVLRRVEVVKPYGWVKIFSFFGVCARNVARVCERVSDRLCELLDVTPYSLVSNLFVLHTCARTMFCAR
jgi:hypothetical protein